jgi:hypothetical protein
VVAVASAEPLALGTRSTGAGDAAAYLAVLRQALAKARKATAAFAVLRVEPRVEPKEDRPAAAAGAAVARPKPPQAAARAQAPGPSPVGGRCGEILLRAQLGEPLSDADGRYLRDSCR